MKWLREESVQNFNTKSSLLCWFYRLISNENMWDINSNGSTLRYTKHKYLSIIRYYNDKRSLCNYLKCVFYNVLSEENVELCLTNVVLIIFSLHRSLLLGIGLSYQTPCQTVLGRLRAWSSPSILLFLSFYQFALVCPA